ncbi:hypothetical protein Pint_14488 [Pistacia integerrima]|uniref:Uncharacterized protein n=1 Tax=Pistacia integerrima TaxID=434235 RepID=A0ACC0Y6N1_9ROSI|nr:hypothetical protein Pint_14488 [Pistacia integerrima]
MFNMGVLFQEWKTAIDLEGTNSSQSLLILTAKVGYSPTISSSASYPIKAIQQHLNWVQVVASDYIKPLWSNLMGEGGLSANKLVLGLSFYGYAWTLENPMDNDINKPVEGLTYGEIKNYIERNGPDVHVRYNSNYMVNYWTKGTIWIGFDDVAAVRAKVYYAKEKKLQVSYKRLFGSGR